jgi:hypothetical protein
MSTAVIIFLTFIGGFLLTTCCCCPSVFRPGEINEEKKEIEMSLLHSS